MHETPARDAWFIASQGEFEALCLQLDRAGEVAIDTEFERQRTYFAELCLVQIAASDVIACVDPYAITSFEPLNATLAAPATIKVLHAARQDIEVLSQAGGHIPTPLFDTQIAAGLAGFADNLGYADLVRELLGIAIDKSQTRTDWRQRPLTAAQLRYAADDVRHLGAVATGLRQRLRDLGRETWLEEECRALMVPESYNPPLAVAWQRVKGIAALPPAAFTRAVALAQWRESVARERNLPRGWIVRDEELLGIALEAPVSWRQLEASGHLAAAAVRRHGEDIVAAMAAPPAYPVEQPEQQRLTVAGKRLLKRLSARTQEIAQELRIAPSLLITRRELESIVRGRVPARLAQGWRQTILTELTHMRPADETEPLCG